MRYSNYVGRRRGNLVVIEDNVGRDKHNHILCRVKCDCGTELLMSKSKFMGPSTKLHCGCLGDGRGKEPESEYDVVKRSIEKYMKDVRSGKYDIIGG